MNFSVESRIPLPKRRTAPRPWGRLAVGESFLVPCQTRAERTAVQTSVGRWGERRGRKFTTQKQPDGSLRVWRVE